MTTAESDDERDAPVETTRFEQRAAAVAHELNNVLTVVRTYTYFARQASNSGQRARDLRVVAAAAERGTALSDWLGAAAERLCMGYPHAVALRDEIEHAGLEASQAQGTGQFMAESTLLVSQP